MDATGKKNANISQDSRHDDQGLCPYELPIRCFSTGICVEKAQECQVVGLEEDWKLTSPLISTKCNIERPLQCFTGVCVAHPQECLEDERFIHQANYSEALQSPAKFILIEQSVFTAIYTHERGIASTAAAFYRACKVVCLDGSCRDKQQNCPPIFGCSSSASLRKQYRCPSSGICSENAESCYRLEQAMTNKIGALLTSLL